MILKRKRTKLWESGPLWQITDSPQQRIVFGVKRLLNTSCQIAFQSNS